MGTSRKTTATIAALSSLWPSLALPQAAPGGTQIDIGVSSKLTYDDNFQLKQNSNGGSTIWDNRVDVAISSVTGLQSFTLNGSGVFRFADIPGRSISGFEDPTLRFAYQLDGVNSRLSVTGRYRNVDREFLDPFQIEQEETNSGAFYPGGGTVTYTNAGVNYVTGINDPLTLTVNLSRNATDYDATAVASNPRLFDSETNTAGGSVAMKLSPVTVVNFDIGVADYSAEDLPRTQRQTTNYAVGVKQDINSVLVLGAQIGYTDVTTDTVNGRFQRTGATGAINLTQTMPNGTVYVAADSTLNQNGTRTSLRFGRDLQLPSGTFTAMIGGTRTPGGDLYAIATVNYSHQLKNSDITVGLNRAVSTNNLNEDILDTRLNINYNHEINSASRLKFGLNWGRSESAGIGGAPTIDRTTLTAAYSRDLTQDWALTGGVQVRKRGNSSAGGNDAQSNSLFLTLDRNFTYRP